MKKTFIILFLFVCLFNSCVMEPPTTFYTFKIVNKTKTIIIVESQLNRNTELYYDTIEQNQMLLKEIPKLNCYQNYHDTLIHSFFLSLKITSLVGKLDIDPYNKANWIDSMDLKGSNICKGGTVYYTLVVNNSNLKYAD